MAEDPRLYNPEGVPVEHRGGRPKGSKGKYGKDIRSMILQAMQDVGDPAAAGQGGALGYLTWLARQYPDHFAGLIKASMPKEINFSLEADTARMLTRMLSNPDEREAKLLELRQRVAIEAEAQRVDDQDETDT